MKKLSKLDESKLFEQLKQVQTDNLTARDQLAGNVRWVVENAQIISSRIVDRLPQYTLHDGTHLFNVLSIMEELLPDETLHLLTPLECALCILTAFTHDLGMVMRDEDVRKYQEATGTPEHQEWLRHCDAYPEERRQIERWKKIRDCGSVRANEAKRRIGYLEGHILAEFIRKRHADKLDPILHWLNHLEEEAKNLALFSYGHFDFKRYLAQIGISHGQRVSWLREILVQGGKEDGFCRLAGGERVNLAFPGLLVRLADIMDFDASRAPSILYRHFGIENDVSILEWNKHMAITGWDFDDHTLSYEAEACEHPVYEKSIRDFVNVIEREIKSVKEELNLQRRLLGHKGERYQLRLPEFVETRIHAAVNYQGHPIYIFHDLQFELDQYEIQQLLMGESLYGDPTLCLRELLQNALDALQMRDLRLKVLVKNPDARVEPTDALHPDETLQIKVTWGHDFATDREYIRILDNGCGMTREVLERYFAKLGKSYYRSPEYERERQVLREHGFIVSPISQFGIGFLSCFMLADEIRIRTRPGRINEGGRTAYDVRLSGSGSLFWLALGTLEQQGTEITLYLKQPFRLDFNQECTIQWIRVHFKRENLREWGAIIEKSELENINKEREEIKSRWLQMGQQKLINPLWIIGRHVIWPLFPIILFPECNPSLTTRLDDRFHWDVLAPIDIELIMIQGAKLWRVSEWGYGFFEEFKDSLESKGKLCWRCFDWQDNQGNNATGTRIRLVLPFSDDRLMNVYFRHLINEIILPNAEKIYFTIEGINVNNLDEICTKMLPIDLKNDDWLWIDLRGYAAPCLAIDRKTAYTKSTKDWSNVLQEIFQKWHVWLQNQGLRLDK